MRIAKFIAIAVAALSLSACVSLKEPIGTSVGFKNDPALEGLWVGHTDKGKAITYVHVILNDNDTMTAIGVTPRHGDDKAAWGTLEMTTVKLGANRYLNERETSDDGGPLKDASSSPGDSASAYYRLAGDTLTISMLDSDKVAKEVDAGRIAGIVHRDDKSGMVQSVEVTADGAALDAWLAKPDAPKLFEPFMVLKRVETGL
ncbi:MAG TPA: hypothetical protein VJ476_09200 [Rhizomicrobium sp.]|nr:hypothetical protein [Rhizomicrobium sp.]